MNQAHEGDQQAGGLPSSGGDLTQPQPHPVAPIEPIEPTARAHAMVTPSPSIVQEAKTLEAEHQAGGSQHAAEPLHAPPVPEVFREQSQQSPEPTAPAAASAVPSAATEVAPIPSGRWQAFWFAVSALALGLAVLTTSLITRQGILRKMLVGYTPQGTNELFGTPFDIGLAKTGLALMIVVVPLFVVATIIVDRYRTYHPEMNSVPMKQVAYVLMVVTVLFIIGSLSAELYLFISNSMGRENAVAIAAPIAELFFAGAYMFWLYTTVSEDRSS